MRAGPLWAVALVAASASAHAETVGFTLSSMPVEGRGCTVHVLDEGKRLAAFLGAGLPAGPDAARAEMRRRMDTAKGRQLRARVARAAAGAALAARLGIERVPAFVVDRRYVVYGVRDARLARELVAGWRAGRKRDSADPARADRRP